MSLLDFFKCLFKRNRHVESDELMSNVINSTFKSKKMYDELKVMCHPDLFVACEAKDKAQVLFQKLQQSKYDCNAMEQLRSEILELYENNKVLR